MRKALPWLLPGVVSFVALVSLVSQHVLVLQTSVLRTSLGKLSSAVVDISIPFQGQLTVAMGPTQALPEAKVFAMVISMDRGNFANTKTPFTVDPALTTILNTSNPSNPSEAILAVSFSQDNFAFGKKKIADLAFTTSSAGQFEVKNLFVGSLPTVTFPPFQEYPLFLESSTILFDDMGAARKTAVTAPPPSVPKFQCSDGIDNDGDGFVDVKDPGCLDDKGVYNPQKSDEIDPPASKPLQLDLAPQLMKTIQTLDGKNEVTVILPPPREQLAYQFTLKATGGKGGYSFAIQGVANAASYLLPNSGLTLKATGELSGTSSNLRLGAYRYPLSVTDGTNTLNFSLQVSITNANGDPLRLSLDAGFSGTEHDCFVGQECQSFFKAGNGIAPYVYTLTGELPPSLDRTFCKAKYRDGSVLQFNSGQAYYCFTPTVDQVGSYSLTLAARDSAVTISAVQNSAVVNGSSTSPATGGQATSLLSASGGSSISFRLVIAALPVVVPAPVIPPVATFKNAADNGKVLEKVCEFLDSSPAEASHSYFVFTCFNGVMEGSGGLMRSKDSLNRAEAAKITTLIESSTDRATADFAPFATHSESTTVNFSDVTVGDWYAPFVYHLYREGIVAKKTLYRPADFLTVAEGMKLVIEAYVTLSDDVLKELESSSGKGDWYLPYQQIAKVVKATVGTADPGRKVQRGEIAELFFKLWKAYPVKKFK